MSDMHMTDRLPTQDTTLESLIVGRAHPLAGKPLRATRTLDTTWTRIAYVLIDIFLVCLTTAGVFYFRFVRSFRMSWSGPHPRILPPEIPWTAYAGVLLVYLALIALFCQNEDLYQTSVTRSAFIESLVVFKAVTLATLLLTAFLYLSDTKIISRLVVASIGLLSVLPLASLRLCRREMVKRRVARGYGARNALIVGAGRVGQALAEHLSKHKELGYVVKGFLDQNHNGDPRILGNTGSLSQIARSHFIDDLFITVPSQRDLVTSIALEARKQRVSLKVVPELFDGLGWDAPIRYIGKFPVMELYCEPIPTLGLLIKRVLDFTLSLFGLLIVAPLCALIALAIKLDSPGPIFYRANRAGKKGQIFVCYKFRTMVADADDLKESLRSRNERNGPIFKIADDPRVTRLGRFLRKYSLDELPQFLNVLKGEMSLVGPRPHPLDDFEQYSLEHRRRLDVKPGITGLWQVTARQDPSFERNMALDLEYIEKWGLRADLGILFRTIPAVFKGKGC